MKSEAPYVVASIQVIGHGIEVRVLWNGLMERGIKDRHLGHVYAEYLPCRQNALDVVRIVERSQINALLNSPEHFIRDQRGLSKQFSAMHHSMSDGADIVHSPV